MLPLKVDGVEFENDRTRTNHDEHTFAKMTSKTGAILRYWHLVVRRIVCDLIVI